MRILSYLRALVALALLATVVPTTEAGTFLKTKPKAPGKPPVMKTKAPSKLPVAKRVEDEYIRTKKWDVDKKYFGLNSTFRAEALNRHASVGGVTRREEAYGRLTANADVRLLRGKYKVQGELVFCEAEAFTEADFDAHERPTDMDSHVIVRFRLAGFSIINSKKEVENRWTSKRTKTFLPDTTYPFPVLGPITLELSASARGILSLSFDLQAWTHAQTGLHTLGHLVGVQIGGDVSVHAQVVLSVALSAWIAKAGVEGIADLMKTGLEASMLCHGSGYEGSVDLVFQALKIDVNLVVKTKKLKCDAWYKPWTCRLNGWKVIWKYDLYDYGSTQTNASIFSFAG